MCCPVRQVRDDVKSRLWCTDVDSKEMIMMVEEFVVKHMLSHVPESSAGYEDAKTELLNTWSDELQCFQDCSGIYSS